MSLETTDPTPETEPNATAPAPKTRSSIMKLPTGVVNKIAAGEVIERPSSVVKELMENAIDAGSTRIDVLIEKGGIDLIRISDNGSGIPKDELPLAVESHATSKIRDADDLFDVASLGFRGEALASIAEVSQFMLRSFAEGADAGYELAVNGGHREPIVPCGCPRGTVIEVRNLFFNTPVRRKFLKTTQTEIGHVSEAFTRIALAFPEIHFTLTHNTRVIHDLPESNSITDRILSFFGPEIRASLIPVSSELDGIKINGFAVDPTQSRSHTRMQYLFLNGRHIRDKSLQHALRESYRGLLLHGRFPIAFLNLEMPADQIDVNVHPAKLEVRFQEGGKLYSQLLGTLRNQFLSTDLNARQDQASPAPGAPAFQKFPEQGGAGAQNAGTQSAQSFGAPPSPSSSFQLQNSTPQPVNPSENQAAFDFPVARVDAWETTRGNSGDSESGIASQNDLQSSPSQSPPSQSEAPTRFDFTRGSIGNSGRDRSDDVQFESNVGELDSVSESVSNNTEGGSDEADRSDTLDSPSPTTLGEISTPEFPAPELAQNSDLYNRSGAIQIHNRYLIAESDEGVEIIDQHALHERILYEQLREKVLAGKLETQRLLVPEPVQLSPSECAAAIEAKEEFAEIGIEIEPFGGDTVLITGYPAMLANHSPAELLRQMIEQCIAGSTPERRDTIDSLMHMISCKAAIKAGDKLTPEEVTVLLENRDLCRDSHHCPHGRPTALIFSREELDRRFKRI